MGEEIFQAILDHPEGLIIGKADESDNFSMLQTMDGKLNVHVPEMAEWVAGIEADAEENALRSGLPLPPSGRPPHEHERQHRHARPGLE